MIIAKTSPSFAILVCGFMIALGAPAHAQWNAETYNLKGGWNGVYLHGDATTKDTLDNILPADVIEVWRWNPNPNQIQFTNSPLIPSPGTPEWTVWKRDGSESGLSTLTVGAYLLKCLGTASNNYVVPIVQSPVPPNAAWVRSGANLLGFPTFKNGASSPTFSSYFATFPAAIAASSKVFQYVGGDFGPVNPVQVFSPAAEQVDRTKAYWFESAVVGNFYGPLEISLTNPDGLDFGRTGAVITARIRNRTEAPVTVTMTPVASDAPPANETAIEGDVPLTLRAYDSMTSSWNEALITAPVNQVIAPGSTVEVRFGIDRTAMTAGSDALYASLLRFTESGNLMDVSLPVRATVASLAGLWVGDATVSMVESKVVGSPGQTTPRLFPLRVLLHIDDAGETRLLSQVFMGNLDDPANSNPLGLCTKESGLKQDQKAGARRLGVMHMPLDRVIDGASPGTNSGTVAVPGSLVRTVSIPFNDPTNPFVHQYHPDHDNRDARPDGTNIPMGNGEESYSIERVCTFGFSATPPAGTSAAGWGSTVIGGDYTEVLSGLHKESITVAGTFVLRRVSEIGSITIN